MKIVQGKTIAAIATPLGTGGIGIIRLSGERAVEIAGNIFRPHNKSKSLTGIAGYSGLLGRIFDKSGDIDECIAFVYTSPKSYTGEDVVELSCHGGMWILQKVLRVCLENGAIPAEPGEFTKRAFLNGKIDLSQAEAVQNLISARGEAAVKAAMAVKDGVLIREIKEIAGVLTSQSAGLAAWADYPDEDIEEVGLEELISSLGSAFERIKMLLASYDRGKIIYEGINAAIVGKPNVGKSTLMNLLSGHNRSIVTDIPGTTRDIIEDNVRIGDIPLRLYDTAGIRNSGDIIELMGVQKSKDAIETVDLVLAVFDGSLSLEDNDLEVLDLLKDKPVIAIVNKLDLPLKLDISEISRYVKDVIYVSALTGEGRETLEKSIMKCIGLEDFDTSAAILNSERQRSLVKDAKDSLEGALDALRSGVTFDAVNVEIDYALSSLLSISGENVSDTVINEVFSRFCVGK